MLESSERIERHGITDCAQERRRARPYQSVEGSRNPRLSRRMRRQVPGPRSRTPRKHMHVLDRNQVTKFLKEAESDPYHALYTVALYSGLRQGELFALLPSDIDIRAGRIHVQATLDPKTLKPLTSKRIAPAVWWNCRAKRSRCCEATKPGSSSLRTPKASRFEPATSAGEIGSHRLRRRTYQIFAFTTCGIRTLRCS